MSMPEMLLKITTILTLTGPPGLFIYHTRHWEMRHIDAQIADEFANEETC